MTRNLLLFFCSTFILISCGSDVVLTPKPRAYPKVDYPEKSYQAFDQDYCNFTFEYPSYAKIQQDTLFFDEKTNDLCWFDVYIPSFDSRLHCTYSSVEGSASLENLKKDAFEMVDYHNKKANYIEEVPIGNPTNEVMGFAFRIEGPAASPYQFYLTDSEKHFLRGALYFNTQVNWDSLRPILSFVMEDMERMVETFKWAPTE